MTDDPLDHDHDDQLVEQDSTMVLQSRDARVTKYACDVDDCNHRVTKIEVGDPASTPNDVRDLAVELYDSFRDDPRSVGYYTLSGLVGDDDYQAPLPVADFLAAAVDLGVDDAEAGRDRDRDGVLATLDDPFEDAE